MSKLGWVASTEGEVALTATTAKTVLNVISPTGKVAVVVAFQVNFDGVTASAEPVLIELCRSTQATAGTSSAVTLRRKRGAASATVTATAAKNYTAEPTVLTLIEDWAVDPYKGLFAIQYPLGREAESSIPAEGMCLRLTAPATVNCRASLEFEEG